MRRSGWAKLLRHQTHRKHHDHLCCLFSVYLSLTGCLEQLSHSSNSDPVYKATTIFLVSLCRYMLYTCHGSNWKLEQPNTQPIYGQTFLPWQVLWEKITVWSTSHWKPKSFLMYILMPDSAWWYDPINMEYGYSSVYLCAYFGLHEMHQMPLCIYVIDEERMLESRQNQ